MSMQKRIFEKLQAALETEYLDVINESHMHSRGTESHFKVIISSEAFNGLRLLQRHRTINEILQDELANHIHALAIHTYTPAEFAEQREHLPESPKCLGGSKFDS